MRVNLRQLIFKFNSDKGLFWSNPYNNRRNRVSSTTKQQECGMKYFNQYLFSFQIEGNYHIVSGRNAGTTENLLN
jgi:hypothetical protein